MPGIALGIVSMEVNKTQKSLPSESLYSKADRRKNAPSHPLLGPL